MSHDFSVKTSDKTNLKQQKNKTVKQKLQAHVAFQHFIAFQFFQFSRHNLYIEVFVHRLIM